MSVHQICVPEYIWERLCLISECEGTTPEAVAVSWLDELDADDSDADPTDEE